MVSYIVDENGDKTHAVIPINEWVRIKSMSVEDELLGYVKNMSDSVKGKFLPSIIFDMSMLFSNLDVETNIEEIMNSHYKYFELVSSKDIGLLYLMRTADLNMFMLLDFQEENIEKGLEEFDKLFSIKNLQGKKLTIEEFKKLQHIFLFISTPLEVLNKFNQSFQIGTTGFSKRVRKDAEIRRLFFYDFSTLYPALFPEKLGEYGGMKEIMENLAEAIYSQNVKESAITQMYKAIRDAKERIRKGKWRIYIGA